MKRRGLFSLMGGAAVAAPVVALAKGEDDKYVRFTTDGTRAVPLNIAVDTDFQRLYRDEFIRAFDARIPDQFMAVNPDMAEYLRKGGR
jgi:hypothetical protein